MDDYAGRVLADRYRLPLPPSDAYEFAETRAFDTYSGQEVLVRQVPLPEVVDAEVLDGDPGDSGVPRAAPAPRRASGRTTRRPTDPAVRRAIEAAQAAAQIPDHPRLDQVFDVFAEGGSLWIVSEVVAARPLAALLAEKPLSPYRAAEVASDVLTALRALHAHGWVHRNITVRTVLVCDDGRVMLTGLAAGAAEEALCGYDPVPEPQFDDAAPPEAGPGSGLGLGSGPGRPGLGAGVGPQARPPSPSRVAAAPADQGISRTEPDSGGRAELPAGDVRAARAGAIAAYRAGAKAAAAARQPSGRISDPYGVGGGPSNAATAPGQQSGQQPGDIRDFRVGRLPGDSPATGAGPGWHGAVPRGAATARGGTSVEAAAPEADAQRETEEAHEAYGAHEAYEAQVQEQGQGQGRSEGQDTQGWDALVGNGQARRGPATPLALERARQARMTVVGAVTERWAPEQAGPVHENWQLAAPVGPATDLWALGALLFRALQGHAPYPEDSTYELVQLVCAEPPAFAEECGPLRPVVESLLRQDPTERPDFEELRGWLRSLVRSAPEPEAGTNVVPLPAVEASKLPVVRRRGELVRRRRNGDAHGRHKRGRLKEKPGKREKRERLDERPRGQRTPGQRGPQGPRSSRRLGRTLLLLVLLGMAAAIAYAMLFMPKAESQGSGDARNAGAGQPGGATSAPPSDPAPESPGQSGEPAETGNATDGNSPTDSATDSATPDPQSSVPQVADGFVLRKDPEGFEVAVASGWSRQGKNGDSQVRYTGGDFELTVVPGRDSTSGDGSDPLRYQRETERELQPFRDSTWSTATGLRKINIGDRVMAEGQFTWRESGDDVYVRNRAMIVDGRYHIVMVKGPESERDEVTRLFEQASDTYRPTG
ncbi:protein kinase [Streptomyces apocyni]|uniref:protein kinase n=1 Tax=Streptomyces apocyni TaxID=2654677 RepID=UPI0012EA784E|nr:protein kinase [Streptomyces apocyni]